MRAYFFIAFIFSTLFFASPAKAQGTFTAASCSQSDVNAVINGPTHTAVNGDTIRVPAGACTWTAGITVPNGIGITIIGSGTPNSTQSTTGASASCAATTITDNAGGNAIFLMRPAFGNSTSRISCINMLPGTGRNQPIQVLGTCALTGCPSVRIDNLTVPGGWAGIGISDDNFAVINNMFGVADHNTVGDNTGVHGSNGVDFINVSHGVWQGVGHWGDNSWAMPDTFGTNQAFYLENNSFNNAFGTDSDYAPGDGTGGGGRYVCRFNSFTNITLAGACTDHGTDTTGRVRGGRQIEFYNNAGTCPGGSCSNTVFGERSATALVFGNTISGSVGNFVSVDTQRRWRKDSTWGPCDGSSPWDTNDGTTYFSGTIGSLSTTKRGPETAYVVASSSTPNWATNEWAPSPSGGPYSFHDVTQNFGFEIFSSTSNSITSFFSCFNNGCGEAPAVGDTYQILRATVCLDQPGRGPGILVIGGDGSSFSTEGHLGPVLSSTGLPGPVNQSLDPMYEFEDSASSVGTEFVSNDSQGLTANRDFYAQNIGQTAQTSPTSPFTGTSGTGWGTLANRPTSCTPRVGYFATDQGTWNQSGNGGQGQLFVCSAPNIWTLYYTPFTYPHPVIAGGTTGNPPNPPTNLAVIVQ